MPLDFATPAYILRAANKDTFYMHSLQQQVMELASSTVGMRWSNNNDQLLQEGSNVLYLLATFLTGKQTIGEEYTDLIPISNRGRLVGSVRRVIFAILYILEPILIRRFARRFFPQLSSKEVSEHIRSIHTGIFFLSGAYFTLPHRFTSIRMAALTPPRPGTEDAGSYTMLGVLVAVQYLWMGARAWWQHRNASRSSPRSSGGPVGSDSPNRPVASSSAGEDDEEEPDEALVGKCMLCLGGRRCPTATVCGHIFCWECIMDWTRAQQPNPLCPLCRTPLTPQTMVPLIKYRSKSVQSPTSPSS